MKELSIEEKAKAYDKMVDRAKKELDACGSQNCDAARQIFRLFPELKESEGERIRAKLIEFFTGYTTDERWWESITEKDILAWLESQGEHKPLGFNIGDEITVNGQICKVVAVEQKPADKVEPKFKVGDFVKNVNHHKQPIYKVVDIDKECYICISDDVTLGDNTVVHFTFDNPYLRLVEQKPTEWTEEDEKMYAATIFALAGFMGNEDKSDWLKSLKERYAWKPSDEQLECLGYAIEKAEKDWSPLTNNRIYLTLKALKEQLEKL